MIDRGRRPHNLNPIDDRNIPNFSILSAPLGNPAQSEKHPSKQIVRFD
jgi:hypothetical protein